MQNATFVMINSQPKNESPVMVSICMTAYNHPEYIVQAIESILTQLTEFKFELVIGEDCSTDNTRQICEMYATKYPGIIKLLPSVANLGMIENLIRTYNECTGKYIAICEGDDYWCNDNKLKMQVDFLEANPGYSICFHRVYELVKNNTPVLGSLNTAETEQAYTINDLAKSNFIHTPSVVFRNGLIKEFPDWFHLSPIGDYVLHLLNAQHGLIKYFPQPMAVYRRHGGGVWSNMQRIPRLEKGIIALEFLLSYQFDPLVKTHLINQRRSIINGYLKLLMKEGNWNLFLEKIAFFSKEDEYISQKWLLEYYPKYIQSVTSSKGYRFASKIKNAVGKTKKKVK